MSHRLIGNYGTVVSGLLTTEQRAALEAGLLAGLYSGIKPSNAQRTKSLKPRMQFGLQSHRSRFGFGSDLSSTIPRTMDSLAEFSELPKSNTRQANYQKTTPTGTVMMRPMFPFAVLQD
jgi:hypothetical protein